MSQQLPELLDSSDDEEMKSFPLNGIEPQPMTRSVTSPGKPSASDNNTKSKNKTRKTSEPDISVYKPRHGATPSVQNLVPARLWVKVPSLMKLIDQQKGTISPKKSVTFQPHKKMSDSVIDDDGTVIFDETELTLVKKNSLDFIKSATTNRSQEIDMQLLATKAAEEFQLITGENEMLNRQNAELQIKYEDALNHVEELQNQIKTDMDNESKNIELQSDIMSLKSKNNALLLEKTYLNETIADLQNRLKDFTKNSNDDTTNENNGSKNSNNKPNNDNENYYLQSLQESTKKYLDLQSQFETTNDELKLLRIETTNLKKSIKKKDNRINELSGNLDLQQNKYLKLKELQGQRIKNLEIQNQNDDIMTQTRLRALTEDAHNQRQQNEELRNELQKAKIKLDELQAEKEDMLDILDEVQQKKIANDDDMFLQLRHLRMSTQRGILGGNMNNHMRSESTVSMSQSQWYGLNNDFASANDDNKEDTQMNSFLTVKSVRRLKLVDQSSLVNDNNRPDTPTRNDSMIIKISNNELNDLQTKLEEQKKLTEEQKKRWELELQKRKRLELAKISAETEFFLLTCLSVKKNLVEEYMKVNPQIEEALMEENPIELYKIAQEQSIPMHHFGIWCESRIRAKYDLPKMKRFSTRFKFKWKAAETAVSKKWKQLGLGKKIQTLTKNIGDTFYDLRERARGASNASQGSTGNNETNNNSNNTNNNGNSNNSIKKSNSLQAPQSKIGAPMSPIDEEKVKEPKNMFPDTNDDNNNGITGDTLENSNGNTNGNTNVEMNGYNDGRTDSKDGTDPNNTTTNNNKECCIIL